MYFSLGNCDFNLKQSCNKFNSKMIPNLHQLFIITLVICLSLIMPQIQGNARPNHNFHSPLNAGSLEHNNGLQNKEFHKLKNDILSSRHQHLRRTSSSSSSGDSLGGAIAGFIFGPIIFMSALIMIWFNEKRAVIDHRRLKLAEQICQQVNPFRRDQISAAHMKLTHITGNSTTTQTIGDRTSNMHQSGALKIVRVVQVMEWRATTHKQNNNTRIQYHLGWQTSHAPRAQDRYNDSGCWFMQNETFYNPKAFVGEYLLSEAQIEHCSKSVALQPNQQNGQQIISTTHRQSSPVINGKFIEFPPPGSNDCNSHGSLRVSYSYCPVGPISVMAKTVENKFEPFPIAEFEGNGVVEKNPLPACCCLSNCIATLLQPIQEIHLIEEQIMTKNQIVSKAISRSKTFTLILRIVTFVMMVVGICLFFSPITILLNHIPLVGGILSGTVGWIIFIAAVIVSIPIYIMAISLAWMWYHPKVGVPILLVGVALITILVLVNTGVVGGSKEAASTVQHMLLRSSHTTIS